MDTGAWQDMQSTWGRRVGHDWVTNTLFHFDTSEGAMMSLYSSVDNNNFDDWIEVFYFVFIQYNSHLFIM